MATIIAIANHKGGVGKTTSTGNMGAAFALMGFKTLIVDCDPQFSLSVMFGFTKKRGYEATLHQALIVPKTNRRNNANHIALPCYEIKENLFITPSSESLITFDADVSSLPGNDYLLKDKIDSISDQFDFILIDCAPAFGRLTINALTAAQYVLIPIQAELFTLESAELIQDTIHLIQQSVNKKLRVLGAFYTKTNLKSRAGRAIDAAFEDSFKTDMLTTVIRNSALLIESTIPTEDRGCGTDIFEYEINSIGAQDYMALTQEVLTKLNIETGIRMVVSEN